MAVFTKDQGGANQRLLMGTYLDSQVMKDGAIAMSFQMLNTDEHYQRSPHLGANNVFYQKSQVDRMMEVAQTYRDKNGLNYVLFRGNLSIAQKQDKETGKTQRQVIVNIPTRDEKAMQANPVTAVSPKDYKLGPKLIKQHNEFTEKAKAEYEAAQASKAKSASKTAEKEADLEMDGPEV